MMSDQAAELRARMAKTRVEEPVKLAKVIAVASGKGGVGKSNFCVNFGLVLKQLGFRPIIIDTDVGFANVEVLLGVRPSHSIVDVLAGSDIWDVLQETPYGLPFLSAGNGLTDIHSFSETDISRLISSLRDLQSKFDIILIDSGAGMGSQTGRLLGAADELVLVTTPEPTSITDAYALLKMLAIQERVPSTKLVVNRAAHLSIAKQAAEKLSLVAERFLNQRLSVLGYILEDDALVEAVMAQRPLLAHAPNSKSARCYRQVGDNYLRTEATVPRLGINAFLQRIFSRKADSGGDVDAGHSA